MVHICISYSLSTYMYLSGPQILHSGINAPDMLVSEGRFLLYS